MQPSIKAEAKDNSSSMRRVHLPCPYHRRSRVTCDAGLVMHDWIHDNLVFKVAMKRDVIAETL